MKYQEREINYQSARKEIEKIIARPMTCEVIKTIHDLVVGPEGQHVYRTGWGGQKVYNLNGKAVYISPDGAVHSMEIEIRKLWDWIAPQELILPVHLCCAYLHWGIVKIHPFADGNGRTARLIVFLILRMYGYDDSMCKNLETYFESNREEYEKALDDGNVFYSDFKKVSDQWIAFIQNAIVKSQNL